MRSRHHQNFIRKARGLAPLRTAVVHPVDEVSLAGAVEAARKKVIVPVLVGPEHKIRAAAKAAKLDLSGYELVSTEHSHAAAAAAVALAVDRKVEALMKGSLHTDEFNRSLDRQPLTDLPPRWSYRPLHRQCCAGGAA